MTQEKFTILTLPLQSNIDIAKPEQLILKVGTQNLDIWTIVYLKRNLRLGNEKNRIIDYNSLYHPRLNIVKTITTTLSELIKVRGLSSKTIAAMYQYIRRFLFWADSKGIGEQLILDRSYTEQQIFEYFNELRLETSDSSKLNINSALSIEQGLLIFFKYYYDENFGKYYKSLKREIKSSTIVPDENKIKKFAGWLDEIFNVSVVTILENKPFPIKFKNLDSKFDDDKDIWFIPNGKSRESMLNGKGGAAWNITDGKIRDVSQIVKIYMSNPELYKLKTEKNARAQAKRSSEKAYALLEAINSDQYHHERINLAGFGCLCFAALFMLETGVNSSVLINIENTDELIKSLSENTVSRAKFRAIKLRAGGKIISVSIGVDFKSKLLSFLKLRKYLVREEQIKSLFIGLTPDDDYIWKATNITEDWSKTHLKRRLKGLLESIPYVSPREMRTAKQDFLIRNTTPEISASLMGHSIETALKAYSNGSTTKNIQEMGIFLTSLEKTIIPISEKNEISESAVGLCSDFNNPIPVSTTLPIQPNCKSTQGCLFCEKYRIHADEKDIRKLLSCRYCLRIAFNLTGNFDISEEIVGTVISRINQLLEEIGKTKKELVIKIEEEVDQKDMLDSYWSQKMEQLTMLGII